MIDARKVLTLAGLGLSLSMASFVSVSVQSVFPYLAGTLSVNQSNAVWTLTFLVIHWALGILLMPHIRSYRPIANLQDRHFISPGGLGDEW